MKFRFKITLCMLALLSMLFGIGGSLLICESFADSLKREKDAAFGVYQMVWSTLQIVNGLDPYLDSEAIKETMEQLCEQKSSAWSALQLRTDTEILYETNPVKASYFTNQPRLPHSEECLFFTIENKEGGAFLILTGAMTANDDEILYLSTAHDISALYAMRQIQQRTYLQVFFVLLLLCAVLSYTVAKLLTAPLQALSQASRAIASGQLASRVLVCSEDEVGMVSTDFNAMAEQLEDKIAELNEALERQEQFVGSFAHEMKTPMTSLIGYAELLQNGLLTQAEQSEATYYIYAEGKRLEKLSRKLLQLLVLKHKDLPLVPLRPADLLEGLVERLRPLCAAKQITISCECQDGQCYLEPDLVWSMLLNLADNAQKAMEHGGHIHFKLEMLEDGCRIYVLDNGRGIPEEALIHLTEAFYRADKARSREQGGFGLGLALCQEIVKLHNGSLQFGNQAKRGAYVIAELKGGRV